METPSSTRMVTRSQTLSAIKNKSESEFKVLFSSSKKTEEPNKNKKERSVLIDITNDSPIVGLAMQTPPSGFMGKRQNSRIKNTPGSGEALLRCQVKTLLQKVEEGTEFIQQQQQQIPIKSLPFSFINNLVTSSSPMRLIAPTPANTPQFHSFSDNDDDVAIKIASPVVAGHFRTTTTTTTTEQVSYYVEEEEEEEQSVTRSLLFDFNDKTPLWEEEEEEEEEEDVVVDELCEVMKKMSVEFKGKHSRFVYDGEDEEKIVEAKEVLHLKGIPTPRGKHLKFVNDEEEKC
ncbi:unnamed protein product [Cochlearia groenlandica]